MFKLISLTSPSGLFEDIVFKKGLNIILGKYSKSGKDINGIGKTTIINFIDYCLLADGPKSIFFSEKYAFLKGEMIRLDFSIGTDEYSIERGFSDKREVLLQKNDANKTAYSDIDLRLILGAEMGKADDFSYSGVYDPLWYRTLMSFFVQDDHAFLARVSNKILNFTVGKRQTELLTYLFLLLGVDNSLMWSFDKNRVELKQLQSDQTRINKQIVEKTGKSVDDFKAECDAVSRKVERLEKGLDEYKFDENQLDLEEKIHSLNTEISTLNKEHLSLQGKYHSVTESLEISIDVDSEKIADLYSSLNADFSGYIKKSLDDVISFRREISANRSKFLKDREAHYVDRLKSIREQVAELEMSRAKLYKMLDEKSAFDSIKAAYSNILDEKSELFGKQAYISQLDFIENEIAGKKSDAGAIVADIVRAKESISNAVEDIKNIFLDIVENSVDTDQSDVNPYFDVELKSNQSSPVRVKAEVPRGGSLGKGRFKILAFDLTVFIACGARNTNFPGFLVHDGVFHGIAHKTRIKFLNYINKRLNTSGLQYIITVNEDEIIFPDNDEVSAQLDFDLSDKALVTLEDNPDAMLLGKEFG